MYILDCVSGYKLEFVEAPMQANEPRQLKFSQVESNAISSEITRLLAIGAIKPCVREEGDFVSNIFSRPKPNGKIRVILNLKTLNMFLKYEHFKMEHLDFVTELLIKDDWMCSIDLKDAYFAVPIHKSCWKFLKFRWNDKLFNYSVLMFGLSPAPRLFTRICKPILALLRSKWHMRCSMYIDDMLLMDTNKTRLEKQVADVISLFKNLGFEINVGKSVLEPYQTIRHLGFEINSCNSTINLPANKCIEIEQKCQELLNEKENVQIRKVAKLLGTIGAFAPATRWGKLFGRSLEKQKVKALKACHGNYDAFMAISKLTEKEISWWQSNGKQEPHYFGQKKYKLKLFSDASLEGWGCHNISNHAGGRWSELEKENHINWLEMKAAFFALKIFAKDLHDVNVLLNIDNTCSIAYINNQGGVVPTLNSLANDIWLWCKTRNLWITARHIPGVKNSLADFKSRNFNDNLEWSLRQDIYDDIVDKWGHPEVDLFASRINHKTKRYVSLEPDPNSIAVDAFAVNWSDLGLCYAFPPFNMIGKVLQKCAREKAQLVLIVPNWPTQHWFPMVHNLMATTKGNPITIPNSQSTVRLPYKYDATHPIWHRLNLLCYRINGNS